MTEWSFIREIQMVKILGTGSYLPEKVLTNNDLEKMVETSDEWIVQRTGIKERRIVKDGEYTSDLAVNAGLRALEIAKKDPKDVDLLILGTSTPDYHIPSCAPTVANKLGCRNIPAFDINSVCTSFMCGFTTAYAMLESGMYKNCLLIGADVYSRIVNWEDRNTCVIFGDGAGAIYLEKSDQGKLLSLDFGSDGGGEDYIKIPVGGVVKPVFDYYGYAQEDFFFKMSGKKVYEFTISVIPESARRMLKDANLSNNDIDFVILHQANVRIIDTISKMLDIDRNKFLVNIEKYGNTSSASIPIVIDEFVKNGVIKKGNKVMILGFGGGLSWGGVIYEW